VSGFYCNLSNYHAFGDVKFIPQIGHEKLLSILQSNPLYKDTHSDFKDLLDSVWPQIEKELYTTEKPYTTLGFPEKGGVTSYFSRNMTDADLALV